MEDKYKEEIETLQDELIAAAQVAGFTLALFAAGDKEMYDILVEKLEELKTLGGTDPTPGQSRFANRVLMGLKVNMPR